MNRTEIAQVEKYLRDTLGATKLTLSRKARQDGSVEVLKDGEFIGVIYRDEEDGEVSYAFHMAIMEIDLPKVSAGR